MLNVSCRCLNGKASTEVEVDGMYKMLHRLSSLRGFRNPISKRYYWENLGGTDDMIFCISVDYE